MHSIPVLRSTFSGTARRASFAIGTVFVALFALPLAASADAAATKGDAQRALSKNSMCIGCHGIPNYRTAYPAVYPVPMIGGQSEGYLVNALRAYKSGERSHPTMRGIAGSLSETDMADLAAYYAAGKAR
jgi:cytochrome c553